MSKNEPITAECENVLLLLFYYSGGVSLPGEYIFRLKAPDTINSVLKKFFTAYNVQGEKIITVLKMYREAAVLQKGVNGNLRRESA